MSDRWEPVARAERARLEQAERTARIVAELVAARRRIADLEATVERVRALHNLHTPDSWGPELCAGCGKNPCPTIAALDPPKADHA